MAKKSGMKVGLALLVGVVGLYAALVWLKGNAMPGHTIRSVEIHFEEVNGLMVGDPVKIRGVVYGKVADIQPHRDYVSVYISLPDSFPLYADAHAALQSKEVLSGKQIGLYPGTGGPLLKRGAAIPGEFIPDVSTAYEWLRSSMAQADTARIRRTIQQLESLLQAGTEATSLLPEVKATLAESRKLMASLNQTAATVGDLPLRALILRSDSMMRRADQMLTTTEHLLARTDTLMTAAQPIIPQVKNTLTQANQSLATVDSLLAKVDGLMAKVPDSLDYTLSNLNETLRFIRTRKLHVGMSLARNNKVFTTE